MVNRSYFLLLFFLPFSTIGQNWTQVTDFPLMERDDAAVFTIGNLAFCHSGLTTGWITSSEVITFNGFDEQWYQTPNLLASPRQYTSSASHNDLGYIFGGLNGTTAYNDLWQFDPTNFSQSQLPSLPSNPRFGAAAAVIADTLYIIGGKLFDGTILSEVWAYSIPGATWTQKNDLPTNCGFRGSAAASTDHLYYLFGVNENNQASNTLFSYEPAMDEWIPISDLPSTPRAYGYMVYNSNQLIAGFGIDTANHCQADSWVYHLEEDVWTPLPDFPSEPRKGGLAFVVNYHLYYTTGINSMGQRYSETWKLDEALSTEELEPVNLQLYPNPASTAFEIEGPVQNYRTELYTLNGQLIHEWSSPGPYTIRHLESGYYLVRIATESNTYCRKLLIRN